MARYKKLRLILGDQLNKNHSWYEDNKDTTLYLMMEMRQETDYVKHHIQKVVAFFTAMRNFCHNLTKEGYHVNYLHLDDNENKQDLEKNIKMVIDEYNFDCFEYQQPDEYRLDQQLEKLAEDLDIDVNIHDSEHFLTKRGDVAAFFENKKTWTMEYFYRDMRKKYDILMENEQPVGGEWNYDTENRKKLPSDHTPVDPKTFEKDVSELVALLKEEGVETIGNINEDKFLWPVNREEGEQMLDFFIQECLPNFGTYQDAMHTDHWSIYHARISFLLNSKILGPEEVVHRVISHWQDNKDRVSLPQIEGFVRQIIGWREFMRGVYWSQMPAYEKENFFDLSNKLPKWYWTGETKMNCLHHAIKQSLYHAYAHHIQRLMVTGNFALLADTDPKEVDNWYLGIYIDAIEWVEITNTRGMSQFADGGLVGTKPYISSANYMNKMSNYCKGCHYSHTKKTGDKACPFNSLYWRFMEVHRDKLGNNQRMRMMYSTWDRNDKDKQKAILEQAEKYLEQVDSL